jgi:hypothetical protein
LPGLTFPAASSTFAGFGGVGAVGDGRPMLPRLDDFVPGSKRRHWRRLLPGHASLPRSPAGDSVTGHEAGWASRHPA